MKKTLIYSIPFIIPLVLGYFILQNIRDENHRDLIQSAGYYYSNGNFNHALKEYKEALEFESTFQINYNIALCYENLFDYTNATKYYNFSEDLGTTRELYYRRGVCYYQRGNYGRSLSDINLSLKLFLDYYLPGKGGIGRQEFLSYTNKYGNGDHINKLLISSYYHRYLILKSLHKDSQALKALQWALFIDPYNPTALSSLETEYPTMIEQMLPSFRTNSFYIFEEMLYPE